MKPVAAVKKLICLLLFCLPVCAYSQEENGLPPLQGGRYIQLKVKKLRKFDSRISRQQNRLLRKLRTKEIHLEKHLANNDSVGYSVYKRQVITFDSIGKISGSENGHSIEKFSRQRNSVVDSIKVIQSFTRAELNPTPFELQRQTNDNELNELQVKLNLRKYVNQLIKDRAANLGNIQSSEGKLSQLTGIQKQVFYCNARMKAFKDIADEPTKAEANALEILQGTNGFENAMNKSGDAITMGGQDLGSSTPAQLEKQGYQTKHLFQASLQQHFGKNVSDISKQIGSQVNAVQEREKEISNARDAKTLFDKGKNIEKPAFKVNPMRGLPFRKRIEIQFGWQAIRAVPGRQQPAKVEPSVFLSFKHTLRLSYGLGSGIQIGLGQDWQHVRLSTEGLGFKSFAAWRWQYGISAYMGYERLYNHFLFINASPSTSEIRQSRRAYNESVLIGLTKKYQINQKYNGAIQILYDLWWQQNNLRSPIVLRFTSAKN